MYLKGVKVRRSETYGYRKPEPGDVDEVGDPVDEYAFTLVRIKDCPTHTNERGRTVYTPTGVKQALKLRLASTWYGYGKPRKKMGFMENGPGKGRWGVAAFTVPFYAVKKGLVYQGTIIHTDVIYCPDCGEAGRDNWFHKTPPKNTTSNNEFHDWWRKVENDRKCTKCGHEWKVKGDD